MVATNLGSHSIPDLSLLLVAPLVICLRSGVQNEAVERANSNQDAVTATI